MQLTRIRNVETPLSRIALGTGRLGGHQVDAGMRLLDAAFDASIRAFDTAQFYGLGDSERIVGAWLRRAGTLGEVILISKCCHPYAGMSRVTPFAIIGDLDDSLGRLGVDRVDVYLLHRDDRSVPVGEIVSVLHEQVARGAIGAYGFSNWSAARVREAHDYASERGLTPPGAGSCQLSLAIPSHEIWPGTLSAHDGGGGREELDFYLEEQIPFFAWSSLAGGFLAGRFPRGHQPGGPLEAAFVGPFATELNYLRLERASRLAAERGASPAQVALAYVLGIGPRVIAIVSSSRPDAMRELAGAADLELSADDIAYLEGSLDRTAGRDRRV